FAACPDPIDFRAFTVVNIYEDKNAYYLEGTHKRVPLPGHRDYRDIPNATMQDMNYYELALGTKSRSGQQWDIWEAVFSPVGTDGYPKRIFDKVTGDIDPSVAEYWRDNFYLDHAVKLTEDFMKSTANPPANAEVKYGIGAEHCWNGDPTQPNHISRLRYNTMYVPMILKHIEESAPPGADLTSWRY